MMQVIHIDGDWALVLHEDTYMVRHLTCKSYLRIMAIHGCWCKTIDAPIGNRKIIPVNTNILKMYLFVTGAK